MNTKRLQEINEYLEREDSNFPDIQPAKELWQPPEKVPAKILKRFPTEASIQIMLDLLMRDGTKDSPEIRDRIRGFVNYRRVLIFGKWKKGEEE